LSIHDVSTEKNLSNKKIKISKKGTVGPEKEIIQNSLKISIPITNKSEKMTKSEIKSKF
jgi:hypothetical protein